ncbi:hypothetical protein V6N13_135905 [Hibiscus sabdariffa]|uniref:Uncharacterized protein n=1 Tax=Hibiscus sabdariffa TaxID=183260 RepID=A0ABR2QT35_9ROSI
MSIFLLKLKRLKPVLKSLNAMKYDNLTLKVEDKKAELERLHTELLHGMNNDAQLAQVKTISFELHTLMDAKSLHDDHGKLLKNLDQIATEATEFYQ